MKQFTPATQSAANSGKVRSTVLENGLTVLTVNHPLHTVVASVFVNVGARFETEAENGLTHFLEHMAFKGTLTRSAKDIVEELEILGSDINAGTGRAATQYYVQGLPQHLGASLDILADVLINSTLDASEIAIEKKVIAQEINESLDSLDEVTMDALGATAYPNQPVGRAILGSKKTVKSFTRDMVADYMKRHYHAANMIVSAVGEVDHEAFVAEVSQRFGEIEAGERETVQPAAYTGGTVVTRKPKFQQADIIMAFPIPGMFDADYAAFDLLSDVLGTGMACPLFQEVREKRALCYSVAAGTSPSPDQSLFMVQGRTEGDTVEEFLRASCHEIARVAKGEISEKDWQRARNQITVQIVNRADRPAALAMNAANDLFNIGRVRTTEEMVSAYMAVTREQVIAAAQKIMASVPTISIAGNVKTSAETFTKAVAETFSA